MSDENRIDRVRQALMMRDADYNVRPKIEDVGNLLHQYDKAHATIDRLQAELAEAYRLRDFHHTDAINSRLEAEELRKELAEAKQKTDHYILRLMDIEARAERAEAHIKDLEKERLEYNESARNAVAKLLSDNAAKDARIAELDHECKAGMEQISFERSRAERAEKVVEEANKQLSEFGADEDTTTIARRSFVEVLQALTDMKSDNEDLRKELADAKAALTKYGDQGAFQALRDANARVESAEVEVRALREALVPFGKIGAQGDLYTPGVSGHVLVEMDDCRKAWEVLNPSPAIPTASVEGWNFSSGLAGTKQELDRYALKDRAERTEAEVRALREWLDKELVPVPPGMQQEWDVGYIDALKKVRARLNPSPGESQ